ncbi:MAG: hypothetical protein ACXWEG_08515 [Actinomycetota bacterium]
MLVQGFEPLRILAGLRSHGVSYVLVGGLGAAVRGGPIETDDVDIVLPNDPQNLPRLALSLQQLGAQLDAPASASEDRVSYDTSYGRLDCLELPSEFASLVANATEMDVGHGVKARVASLEDLARLKRTSPDLEGAVRLHALVGSAPVTYEELTEPADADPEPNGRIDRILGKLANVDVFLTEVNRGERPLRRKRR